jgi:plastocyanin
MARITALPLAFLLVACNSEPATTPSTVQPSLAKAAGVGTSATMEFGEVTHDVGSPFDPALGHDGSGHAADKVRPRTVVIEAGGSVTFDIGAFHQVSIYEAGTTAESLDIEGFESLTSPFPIPDFLIVAPDGRIASNNLTTSLIFGTSQWVSPAGTFDTPGKYFVMCRVAPHFLGSQMYGWVIVK